MNLKNRKRTVSLGLTVLCTTVFMAAGASAEPTLDAISVSYVSTDVSTPEGAQALYAHIQRAAKLVCHEPDVRELAQNRLYQQCFARAVDAAVAKVDSNALTALHHSKGWRSAAG
jgi:UrcA family protein